jgi:hypothetical protein
MEVLSTPQVSHTHSTGAIPNPKHFQTLFRLSEREKPPSQTNSGPEKAVLPIG